MLKAENLNQTLEVKKISTSNKLCLQWQEHSGQLMILKNGKAEAIRLQPCFPWLYPESHFSLRNSDNQEVGFVKDIDDLDANSRQALRQALDEALFCFEIQDICKVEEEFELRVWQVRTAQGERVFQTRLTDWPRLIPSGGYLIKDVQGDLYLLRDPKQLSAQGRKLFQAFVD